MRESKTLEYKEKISNSFLKTVSAFSNFGDGEIKFGIRDDGQSIGLENPTQSCLDIENKINDAITPKPDFSLNIEGNNVVVLKVRKGKFVPYFYKGKAYRRSDSSSVEVDQLELRRLTLEGSNLSYDELISPDKELSFSHLSDLFKEKFEIKEIDQGFLRTFNLKDEHGNYTIAGSLLSDSNTFPGIDIARFGDSISQILDRKTFEHQSIIKSYEDAVDFYRRYYQYETIQSAYRELVELIPEDAFREAIANALVHRTWDIRAHIKVEMYKDKIVITSPGGLPTGISEEQYLYSSISIPRNAILADIFFRLRIIERFGTGITRIQLAYGDSFLKPKFVLRENFISVTLPVLNDGLDLSKDEKILYDILLGEESLSAVQLMKQSNFSRYKVLRVIRKLKERNLVTVIGSGRNTHYALIR